MESRNPPPHSDCEFFLLPEKWRRPPNARDYKDVESCAAEDGLRVVGFLRVVAGLRQLLEISSRGSVSCTSQPK